MGAVGRDGIVFGSRVRAAPTASVGPLHNFLFRDATTAVEVIKKRHNELHGREVEVTNARHSDAVLSDQWGHDALGCPGCRSREAKGPGAVLANSDLRSSTRWIPKSWRQWLPPPSVRWGQWGVLTAQQNAAKTPHAAHPVELRCDAPNGTSAQGRGRRSWGRRQGECRSHLERSAPRPAELAEAGRSVGNAFTTRLKQAVAPVLHKRCHHASDDHQVPACHQLPGKSLTRISQPNLLIDRWASGHEVRKHQLAHAGVRGNPPHIG